MAVGPGVRAELNKGARETEADEELEDGTGFDDELAIDEVDDEEDGVGAERLDDADEAGEVDDEFAGFETELELLTFKSGFVGDETLLIEALETGGVTDADDDSDD